MGRSKRRGDGIRPRACGVQIYRIPISTRASTTKVASRARENRRNPALSLPLPSTGAWDSDLNAWVDSDRKWQFGIVGDNTLGVSKIV